MDNLVILQLICTLIALCASIIGSSSGIGGGIIIKPVLDSTGLLDVAAVSFLSGCTVLTTTSLSVWRSQGSSYTVNWRVTLPLAVGAALGGVCGKWLFNVMLQRTANGNAVGTVQAVALLVINIGVFAFTLAKPHIKAHTLSNRIHCTLIGLALGVVSSFLGIGGGPINIAVLYYCFSTSPKTTAINSLFVICLSQLANLCYTMVTRTVPAFDVTTLALMCGGGVIGSLCGGNLRARLSDKNMGRLFMAILVLLMCINVFNIVRLR